MRLFVRFTSFGKWILGKPCSLDLREWIFACVSKGNSTNLTHLRGRAPVGERLYGTAPFDKWRTQTIIAGLTQDAVIAPWVIKGAMNGPAFDTYVKTQPTPALDPGTIVILDNLSTHKSPRAAENHDGQSSLFQKLSPTLFRSRSLLNI